MSTASNHYQMKSNIRMIRLDSKDPICYTIKAEINQIKKDYRRWFPTNGLRKTLNPRGLP